MWENDKLEQQVEFLEKNKNFIMVYSNFYTLKNDKKFIQYNNKLPEGNITKYLLKKIYYWYSYNMFKKGGIQRQCIR